MATLADLQAKLDQAIIANEASDYDAAMTYAISAQAMAAGIADAYKGDARFMLARTTINQLIDNLRRKQSAATFLGPFVQVPVTYQRPSTSDSYE